MARRTIPLAHVSERTTTRVRAESSVASHPRYRVTAFEALMLAQDTPAHPMIAQIEVGYTGRLRRDHFETSLSGTLSNHPLLQAWVDDPARPKRWTVQPEQVPFLDWDGVDAPLRFPDDSEFIDLTREIGVRVWVREDCAGGRMILQFHHACTDGTGVMEFVLDLLRSYHALELDRSDLISSRDPQSLRRRDRFHGHTRWGRLWKLLGAVRKGAHWTRMKPIPLGEAATNSDAPRPMETILHETLSPQVLDQLLTNSRGAGVTLNDLLLRDLFLVLSQWSTAQATKSADCLCVCIPVNLRLPHEPAMPAANKVMLSFLHRSPSECTASREFLENLHVETQHIKQTRRGLIILEVLRLAMKIRGKIPTGLLGKSSFATAVLSNLGRVDALAAGLPIDQEGCLHAGGLVVNRIVTAPNGQMGTSVVFVASTYAGKLTIAICHDPRVLSRERAERLLQNYVEQLQETSEKGLEGQTGP